MYKPILILVAAPFIAACSTIDFGPEPGTPGDEFHWHFNPDLHEPGGARKASAVKKPASEAQAQQPSAGSTEARPATATAATAPAPAPESEALFEDAIREAVAAGDVDKALRLLEDAERLGSRSARRAFIEAVQARSQD